MDQPVVCSLVRPIKPAPVLPADALHTLAASGWVVLDRPLKGPMSSADLPEWIGPDAEAVLTSWGCPTFTPEVHRALPRLRFIGHCAGSVKALVTPETFAAGVAVTSAVPVMAQAVAEYCLAVTLWSLLDLGPVSRAMREHPGRQGWQHRLSPRSRSLGGQRIGIVSASRTARAFIGLLRPFQCDIAVFDPTLTPGDAASLGVELVPLQEVMRRPIVSVHAPDLPATRGMIGREELACIPQGGLLINSSRPSVLDEAALYEALQDGRFSAVLDVYGQEPLPGSSPLYGLNNVLLTPHVAGYSTDAYANLGRAVVADLLRWKAGEPMRMAVDGQRWEVLA